MTPEEFFTQEQIEKIGQMRVGSGMIIVKTDEGLVGADLVYIDSVTGTVNDWETGKPLVVELWKFDRASIQEFTLANQRLHKDPPAAPSERAKHNNPAGV